MSKKKYENFIWRFLFILLTISSCTAQKNCNNCGIVIYKMMLYKPEIKKYIPEETYYPDTKIWYSDSTVIVKTMGINAPTVDWVETKREIVLMYYTYIDLRKMLFYKYASFSDTAKIIQSYNEAQSDTVFWGVNWRFYQPKNIPYTEPLQNMDDTIIEKKIFKRIKLINNSGNDTNKISIAYFDCKQKATMFVINKALTDIAGCPMVKYYILPSIKWPTALAGELDFISDKLTEEELKIFDAWGNNVKKYPVKQ
ncbi:MAG: hypothetical protein WCI49_15195 [Ferruginibacter sp.]